MKSAQGNSLLVLLFRKELLPACLKLSLSEAFAWSCTALVVLLCIAEFCQPIVQADDAFISYRYALNLATGHGLVFNQGEYVEGFTNLLWTLLIAGLLAVGVHAPAAAQVMSVLCAALSLVLLHIYVRRFLPRRFAWLAALAPVVMMASNSFACWMTTGLETPLLLLLTIAALLAYDSGRQMATAWLCILAFLCRPEGGIEAAILLGARWTIEVLSGERNARLLWHISKPPLLFAASVAALTLFRVLYYGDFIPNTFRAKVGQVPIFWGWLYQEKFFGDGPLILLPGLLLACVVSPRLRAPALFVLATVVYTVAISGDVFAYGRFLLPTLPVLLAGAAAASAWVMARQLIIGVALALALPAAGLVSLFGRLPLPGASFTDEFGRPSPPPAAVPYLAKRAMAERHWLGTRDEKKLVRALSAKILSAKPDAKLVACIGIGRMGFYNMNWQILDMVGLTDRHVAESTRTIAGTILLPGHSRTDSDYVLSRKPDIIIILDKNGLYPKHGPGPLQLPAVVDMLSNPGLEQHYAYQPDGGFWIRKE